MAAIGHRFPLKASYLCSVLLVFGSFVPLRADQQEDIRKALDQVASSLTAGDAAGAISPFSKTLPQYERLRDDFMGLTSAFSITNEVDVLAESDTSEESLLTIHWAITLSDHQSSFSNQRASTIQVRFVREKSHWKMNGFSPIDLFDPAEAQKSTKP